MGGLSEGNRGVRIVVCDTGPILHLREAGVLALLAKAGEVLIPPGVNNEMTVHEPERPLVKTRLPATSPPKLHWP